ncbi:MAG: Gfo/Idh/MocA family oxidoreductase [Woeseiaceae bacterium]
MTLRVAVAGAGWVSAHHLRAWRTLSGVDAVAICDPDPARAAARATTSS